MEETLAHLTLSVDTMENYDNLPFSSKEALKQLVLNDFEIVNVRLDPEQKADQLEIVSEIQIKDTDEDIAFHSAQGANQLEKKEQGPSRYAFMVNIHGTNNENQAYLVGVAHKFADKNANNLDNQYSYGLLGMNGKVRKENEFIEYFPGILPAESTLIVVLDMDSGELGYFINGEFAGVAVKDDKLKEGTYLPTVWLGQQYDTIQLVHTPTDHNFLTTFGAVPLKNYTELVHRVDELERLEALRGVDTGPDEFTSMLFYILIGCILFLFCLCFMLSSLKYSFS